jgi:hypothetical protein
MNTTARSKREEARPRSKTRRANRIVRGPLKLLSFYVGDHPDEEKKQKLLSLTSTSELERKTKILRYLNSGLHFAHYMGIVRDLLDRYDRTIDLGPDVFTDGVWAWTSEIHYYVQKYNLALPNDFLNHMEAFNWKAPRVRDGERLFRKSQRVIWENWGPTDAGSSKRV